MASPPAYSTVVSNDWHIAKSEKSSSSYEQRWNIREAVNASRTRHVESIVEQLLPEIKARAQQGHSKTELVLIPSDEENARHGQIVGIDTTQPPLIIQFEGHQNSAAFWSQDEAIAEIEQKLIAAVTVEDEVHYTTPVQQPTSQNKTRSSSWFGRRVKEPELRTVAIPIKQPVSISVAWDDLHCRSETEYGLFETKRAKVVSIVIDVR